MGKKYKRQLSKSSPAGAGAVSRQTAGEFNPDYSDVKKDLRRIGLLAGTFILVLIAVAVVLRFYPLF